jgi:hypothetical protein
MKLDSSKDPRVEIPEMPIVETFRGVFDAAVAHLETTEERWALEAAWEVLGESGIGSEAPGSGEETIGRGLDVLDDARRLPSPERHFLRVVLLRGLAGLRILEGRLAEARFIRDAAAAYLGDHLPFDRHPLHGFLLFFQTSHPGFVGQRELARIDDPEVWAAGWAMPVLRELPVC